MELPGRGKYEDLIMDTATKEIGHVEMLATMIARLLEGAPATMTAEAVTDSAMAAVLGGMDSQQSIVTGGGAMPANPDFRADSAAEAQGRLETAAVQDLKGTVKGKA